MNKKKLNIESELDSLREFETIIPREDFQDEIIQKLKNSRKRNNYYKSGLVILIFILVNFFSIYSLIKSNLNIDRQIQLKSIINSFTLDR